MDPEWYVGQDIQEVNEMWETGKVAGRWTERRAAGGDDRTERLGTIRAGVGGTHGDAVNRSSSRSRPRIRACARVVCFFDKLSRFDFLSF